MFRRIHRITPGVVLLAAGAFARNPVRVGPAQASVLHGLVCVDADLVLRRLAQHAQVVANLELPVVPFVDFDAVAIDAA